jgi:hypothetical protein
MKIDTVLLAAAIATMFGFAAAAPTQEVEVEKCYLPKGICERLAGGSKVAK